MEGPLRSRVPDGTCLIETFAARPRDVVANATLHLDRMARGADVLGYPFDRDAARAAMSVETSAPMRCRLTLDAAGHFDLTTAPLPPTPPNWRVAFAMDRLRSSDEWLSIKSTQRALYDAARAALPAGIDEWVFLNERDEICEGTITNIFVETADGRRVTPIASSGVLPGILRQSLLQQGWKEAVLTKPDLFDARAIWMGNALRGLIPVAGPIA